MNCGGAQYPQWDPKRVVLGNHVVHIGLRQPFDHFHRLERVDFGSLLRADLGEAASTSSPLATVVSDMPRPNCLMIALRRRWRSIHSSSEGKRTRTVFTPAGVRSSPLGNYTQRCETASPR